MIVTGMFVAQVARAAEGTLDVLGGVLDWIRTDAIGTDTALPVTLVLLVQRNQDDPQQGAVTVEILGPSGEELARANLEHHFPESSENGFLYVTLPLPVAVAGRHTFIATADGSGHSAAIGLRIESPDEGI